MTSKKPTNDTKPTTIVANDPDDLKGTVKRNGGSQSDHWNNTLANQTLHTLWALQNCRLGMNRAGSSRLKNPKRVKNLSHCNHVPNSTPGKTCSTGFLRHCVLTQPRPELTFLVGPHH